MSAAATGEEVRTDAPPNPDKDDLLHIHCGRCWRKARAHAQPPRAFCGKQKYGWSAAVVAPGDRQFCVVCVDMAKNQAPCVVCGLKPRRMQ